MFVRLGGSTTAAISVNMALLMVPILGIFGVAVDYQRAAASRDMLQEALDAAVIAGARDGSTNWTTVAQTMFTATLPAQIMTTASASFSYDSSSNYHGSATGRLSTTFAGLLGISTLDVGASATAVAPKGNSVCILILNTAATPGLLLNSGATLNMPNCEIDDKSVASPAATFNSGTTVSALVTCVAGTSIIDNGGSHASLKKGCTTASDPFAGTLPTPASSTCTYSNLNINGGSTTLNPGVYCGWVNFNGSPTVTLSPGVYVLKNGGWNVTGSLSGTGVTFYFADTSMIQFNSVVALNITAPTTGTYANLLMYEASGLSTSSISMNATSNSKLTGLIYWPSRAFTLNSNANITSSALTLVVNTFTVNSATWSITGPAATINSAGSSSSSKIYISD